MKSVDRVIDILEVFLTTQKGAGVVELATRSGNNVSTSYRIVSTLVERGYLIQPQVRGKYYLAPKLLRFSAVIRMSTKVREVAHPFLLQLNKETKESVNLAILEGTDAIYMDHIETSYNLRLFTQVGRSVPLHCTGVGKIFLANMTDDELKRYMNSRSLTRFTPNTITETKQLEKELALIRRDEIATDNEEMERGVKCVAAPIKSINGYTVACVSISGPSARIDGAVELLLKSAVKDSAFKISQELGYLVG